MKRAACCLALLAGVLGCGSQSTNPGTTENDAASPSGWGDDAGTSSGMKPSADASSNAPVDATSAPRTDGSAPPTDGSVSVDAAASDDGAPPNVNAPLLDGGEVVQFVASDETTYFDPSQTENSTGTVSFGVANTAASDGWVANLTRKGGESTLGTDGAEEIVSNRMFSFGTFSFHLSLATI
jgi:hypothetical protein